MSDGQNQALGVLNPTQVGLHNLINKIPMIHPKVSEIPPENANERTNRACNCQAALEFAHRCNE